MTRVTARMLFLCGVALSIIILLFFSSRAGMSATPRVDARASRHAPGSSARSFTRDVRDQEPPANARGGKYAAAQRSLGPSPGDIAEDQGAYDEDPEINEIRTRGLAARGIADYVPLQCEGGEPDVDLSYWKDISQDK